MGPFSVLSPPHKTGVLCLGGDTWVLPSHNTRVLYRFMGVLWGFMGMGVKAFLWFYPPFKGDKAIKPPPPVPWAVRDE